MLSYAVCLMLYPDSTKGTQTAPQTWKKFFWDMLFGCDDLIGFPGFLDCWIFGFSDFSGFSDFLPRSSGQTQDKINLRRPK
jgi:hypothetical protein